MPVIQKRGLFTLLLALVLCLFTLPLYAGDYDNDPRLQEYLRILRDSGQTIHSAGEMFEILVRHHLEDRYPPSEYEIIGSIEYFDTLKEHPNQTLGELDVVVLERDTGNAVLVGEVKFWRDLAAAIKKAKEQLTRFDTNLRSGKIKHYRWKPDHSRPFSDDNFINNNCYEFYGPKGATSYGFTEEIDLTTKEGGWLLRQVRPVTVNHMTERSEKFEELHSSLQ